MSVGNAAFQLEKQAAGKILGLLVHAPIAVGVLWVLLSFLSRKLLERRVCFCRGAVPLFPQCALAREGRVCGSPRVRASFLFSSEVF